MRGYMYIDLFFVCFSLLSFDIDGQQNKKVAHLPQTSCKFLFLFFLLFFVVVVVGLVWTSLAIDDYPLLLLLYTPKI
jgi:hypothetical protein